MATTNETPRSSSPALEGQPDLVHAVMIKLPLFYVDDPVSWFDQAEAQFAIHHITGDENQHWYVCVSLDAETSSHAMCALSSMATSSCYTHLKSFLVNAFSPSIHQRAEKPLDLSKLSNRSPR